MVDRAVLAFAIVATSSLAGCSSASDGPAHVAWGSSIQQCTDGVCHYGENADRLSDTVRCKGSTALGWTASQVIHGSARLWVEDGKDNVVFDRTVSTASGVQAMSGASGTWTLHADLHDLNGQFQATLECA